MERLLVDADLDYLDDVTDMIINEMDKVGCTGKSENMIRLAIEEVFVNIVSYAYSDESFKKNDSEKVSDDVLKWGKAEIEVDVTDNPSNLVITFSDMGQPYDPLKKEDPDVNLAIEDRPVGGLGIYLVKQIMDDIRYEYSDGKNVLTLIKNL